MVLSHLKCNASLHLLVMDIILNYRYSSVTVKQMNSCGHILT